MTQVLLCLDSGTTAVKAAAFDLAGQMLASTERPNRALHRDGLRIEQDMVQSREDAFAALRAVLAELRDPQVAGLVVTGQGDGLWPVDADGAPLGRALTWLDGRARGMVAELAPALDAVQAITGSRLTAASASLQLLWLQRHEPARFARIRHALRLKEWLFLGLTGVIAAEPSAVLPAWGRWQTGAAEPEVGRILGLAKGTELLPDFRPVGECRAALTPAAAAALGITAGIPVLLGPGDVHATLIGLGLGSRAGVARASIFGTSSIHARLQADPAQMPAGGPPGAMVQKFALGPGYLCFHPAFNGATLLHHMAQRFADLPSPAAPAWSELVLHPFFEPGGERAPWTDPHARGALLGVTAASTPAEIAWAGREALAFVAHHSHRLLGAAEGSLSLGGGLAGDGHFAAFLATTLGRPVQRSPGAHAGARGLAAVAARYLLGADAAAIAADWIGPPAETVPPDTGAIAAYAAEKYTLFADLVAANAPFWPRIAALRARAELMTGVDG